MDINFRPAESPNAKCRGCGCAHALSDCNYIDHRQHRNGNELQPWLYGAAMVYRMGPDTWRRMILHMKTHGYMQTWTQSALDRFTRDVEKLVVRLTRDDSQKTHQSHLHTYGEPKVPPPVKRPTNTPAWQQQQN
jgi:hypothetical protein